MKPVLANPPLDVITADSIQAYIEFMRPPCVELARVFKHERKSNTRL